MYLPVKHLIFNIQYIIFCGKCVNYKVSIHFLARHIET